MTTDSPLDRFVEQTLTECFRRCEIARDVGIPLSAVVDGAQIPSDWILDEVTQYFLPPNVLIDLTAVEWQQ